MMTMTNHLITILLGLLSLFIVQVLFAEEAKDATDGKFNVPEDIQLENLNQAAITDATLDHYDDLGYPEDKDGQLIVSVETRLDNEPMVYMKGDKVPSLLYAQFSNTQRDAVFLARLSSMSDTLPNGKEVVIPYGYGALKLNTVYLSIVEAQYIPHFSDNIKEYKFFPLQDLYIGAAAGRSGINFDIRYVYIEQWVGYAQAGFNLLGALQVPFNGNYNHYLLPLHIGAGYRFPSLIRIIGTNWTVGFDALMGFLDADGDTSTPAFTFMPGGFLDLEWVLFGGVPENQDYRSDPKPYNYNVTSIFLRLAVNVDVTSGFQMNLNFLFGLRYNILGPSIPEHKFKETKFIYAHQKYIDQKEQERKDKEERLRRMEGSS